MTDAAPVVYVVDDDPSVRRALKRLLKSAGLTAVVFASAGEFLASRRSDAPSCLILDLRLPAMSGLDLQRRMAGAHLGMPIVFLTGHGTVPAAVEALKAGAVEFLQKPVQDGVLLDAVRKALERDRADRSADAERDRIRHCAESLTPREREVFALVVTGLLNKQIALKLGTVEKTIKVHRARVMEKMKAASLADLVRMAEAIGLGPRP